MHANKGDDSGCTGECGEKDEGFKRYLSEGVFRMRFTGYMLGMVYKVHQEALLIYNKYGDQKNTLAVDRMVSASKLSTIAAKSQEHQSYQNDIKNPKLLPMLNPPNYAPYEGGGYKNKDLVSLNELTSCFTRHCKDHSGKAKLQQLRTLCF